MSAVPLQANAGKDRLGGCGDGFRWPGGLQPNSEIDEAEPQRVRVSGSRATAGTESARQSFWSANLPAALP